MNSKETVFGIAGNKKKPLAIKTALRAIKYLKKMGIKFFADSGFLKTGNLIPLKKMRVDLFLVFGGDGTMLYILREIKRQLPVLGVNCGTRGHLMQTKPEEIESAVEKIVSGHYSVEQRARLNLFVDGKAVPSALNEIIVAPKKSFTLSTFSVGIDGNVSEFCADAIAIATPTGSTAFAFSAGGKKIESSEMVFEILPVHPFGGIKKPFLVPDSSKISVVPLEKGIACEAIIDGQKRIGVKKKVVVEKSRNPALFVRLLG